jgi:phage terminase Nu1 subunit (DNA packaging protein)
MEHQERPASFNEAVFVTQEKAVRCTQTTSCGKHRFTSQKAAKAALHNREDKGANVSALRAYFCPSCHGWHMTSRINSLNKNQ